MRRVPTGLRANHRGFEDSIFLNRDAASLHRHRDNIFIERAQNLTPGIWFGSSDGNRNIPFPQHGNGFRPARHDRNLAEFLQVLLVWMDCFHDTRQRARAHSCQKNHNVKSAWRSRVCRPNRQRPSVLVSSGISRIDGATMATPPLDSISFAISAPRRLSNVSTRSPAKSFLGSPTCITI